MCVRACVHARAHTQYIVCVRVCVQAKGIASRRVCDLVGTPYLLVLPTGFIFLPALLYHFFFQEVGRSNAAVADKTHFVIFGLVQALRPTDRLCNGFKQHVFLFFGPGPLGSQTGRGEGAHTENSISLRPVPRVN